MKLNDDILSRAATLVRDDKMNSLLEYETYPTHEFSETFEQNMQGLIDKLGKGEIKPYKVSMGWQYYVRHGMVAVLICFLLICAAAPQAVIAGYHKLVEIIETVVTEYTEYRYQVNETVDDALQQVTFGYLPNGMEIVKERNTPSSYHVEYEIGDKYFALEQRLIMQENNLSYVVDTENAIVEKDNINDEEIIYIYKDGIYNYVWIHGNYHIKGDSNLAIEEIAKILENIK